MGTYWLTTDDSQYTLKKCLYTMTKFNRKKLSCKNIRSKIYIRLQEKKVLKIKELGRTMNECLNKV